MTSVARTLSELAIDTSADVLSPASHDAAAKMLLDTCACACAGRKAPAIAPVIDLECELSAAGKGSVFFTAHKLSLPAAAFCNAAMIHALDFDNNYPAADIHILSIVVPVAFACCEERGTSGRECVAAMILGVEAAARIAKPYQQAKRAHSYFLTTSLVGGWGGVATGARLLGLSVQETLHAMGIYYAHTCGNRQALLERALTKRIQPAIAARAALYSVLLARRGVTGPEQIFEGAGGFYRCYTLDPPPPLEHFTSGQPPAAIEELTVKVYPTCGIHHANIVSALELKKAHGFDGSDIERVQFYLREGGGTLVSMPFALGPTPQVDAQFCAPYAIALALNKGRVSVADFTTERIRQDRDTIELALRTTEVDRFADLELQHYPARKPGCNYTKVVLRDGRVLEHESPSSALNDPKRMGVPEVRAKFHQCASMYDVVDPCVLNRQADAILNIGHSEDVRAVIALLFS
jgi:2-methylcitrate dehydratase PrpD